MTQAPTIQILRDTHRHDIVNLLDGNANFGVELGVAEGVFSKRMVESGKFEHFVGIDMYADDHDVNQYKKALRSVGLFSDYKLLRMRFDEAIDLFENESVDFVYVDGYAHGGEEGGETIFEWFKKVKVGGVIAGDDYHPDWPLVCEAVNEFAIQTGEDLFVTDKVEPDNPYCRYPTWAIRKRRSLRLEPPEELVRRGKKENARIALQKEGGVVKRGLKRIIPAPILNELKRIARGSR